MATASPNTDDHGEDNFVLELKRVRRKIKQKFTEMSFRLKSRESELLNELDIVLNTYTEYHKHFEERNEKKRDIVETIILLEEKLKKSQVKGLHEKLLKQTKEELESIEILTEPKMVHFVCENETMLEELGRLGELVEITGVDFKNKVHPIVSVCNRGNGINQLNNPLGVAVDNITGGIYVADQSNHCVKVFDNSGNFVFKFGTKAGEGKMNYPRYLTISKDRILISHGDYSSKIYDILAHQLTGEYINKIGKSGKGKLEFKYPCGLASNESNGDIYICDYNNNRIQILSNEMKFKIQFGDDKLKNPRDVKLSKDHIYILDESNPCLHLYSHNFILQRSVITRGEKMQIVNPWSFFIYRSNIIMISDRGSNCILIFNQEFELIHKIITSPYPMGVLVDNNGKVIVVCQADRDCLQIF